MPPGVRADVLGTDSGPCFRPMARPGHHCAVRWPSPWARCGSSPAPGTGSEGGAFPSTLVSPAPTPPGLSHLQGPKQRAASSPTFRPPRREFPPRARPWEALSRADGLFRVLIPLFTFALPAQASSPRLLSPLQASAGSLPQTLRGKNTRQPQMPNPPAGPRHRTIIIWAPLHRHGPCQVSG